VKRFCQIEGCENPAAHKVRVSQEKACDGWRFLCNSCEEAYAIGAQHGIMLTEARRDRRVAILEKIVRVLRRSLRRIAREAKFTEDDGAMDLGEALLRIESMAQAVLPEKVKGAKTDE
jgi:hypothetical protein